MQPCTRNDTKHASQGLCQGIERAFVTFFLGQTETARLQQTAKVGKGLSQCNLVQAKIASTPSKAFSKV